MSGFSIVLLLAGIAGAFAVADPSTWDPPLIAVLLILVLGADALTVEYKRLSISGSFLGIVLAMALLGPVQAAVIGGLATLVDMARVRMRVAMALSNLAAFFTFPLAGGLVLEALAREMDVRPTELGFAVPLVAAFALVHIGNIALILVAYRVLDGIPILARVREIFMPLLPSEIAMVLLASVIVYAEAHLGVAALALLIALFFVYLVLIRELLKSQERAEELERRGEQLASLQVGVLTAMLRTLSMRDRMTARHSAAVARYTRELSRAAGCNELEQDLAHTAGLLHDIGKFILPDSVLKSDGKPDEEGWRLIKMHPYQGARVVREVEGYGPVADIIWCHHERIDGNGYPRGLAGDDIPRISRMISIADTYDVMTSRDSYRDPVSSEEAIAELRRVSGKQLDGELVEIFVQLLADKGVAFRHADDADFEAELAFERRVRDHAAPRELPEAA